MIPVCSFNDLDIYQPGEKTRDLARRLECSELAAAVLDSRAADEEQFRQLLNVPDLRRQLDELFLGRAASAARELWLKAVPGKRVFVYGDYDVDGVSSTVIALELAQQSGAAEAVYYIPDRRSEGYGLHPANMRRIIADGFETLIVADCGSKDVEAVEMARAAGMDVLIFDHHAVEGDIVRIDSLVNPQMDGDAEAKRLCATAVLWCWAWQSHILPESRLAGMLQLAALATVSDCMPLGPLNRSLTREGIKMMRRAPRRGLRELLRSLCPNEPDSMIDENRLSMKVIPCLNAAGRVQVADVAVNVLSGLGSPLELQRSVDQLLDLNRRRRDISAAICTSINAGLEQGERSQVLFNGSWPVGILSAIASRLCSEHNKAFALAAPSGGGIRGTLRVPSGANAVELLKSLDDLLDAWGGHKSAAGFSVDQLKWPRLERELNSLLQNIKVEKTPEEVIEFEPDRITGAAWDEVQRIGPFGNGNPLPAFFVPLDARTTYAPLGKRGLHTRVLFGGNALLAFNGAEQIERTEGIRGWIYRPRPNLWQGRVSLQYIVEGIVVA
ncbi:single-stranded DNA exonuclease RecJ [Pyramidobacter sp. SM-530-WT-4B]|uniref:Single-stranded-DNA-specific exonuclease RecJ n=1 Tax=Pyramidobacter porci TaxID=2605789 RepID=A0A6L5YBB6_9BACT|nr:single-stranded DNA exonuclease RecJ [Pyramidobacter porci]